MVPESQCWARSPAPSFSTPCGCVHFLEETKLLRLFLLCYPASRNAFPPWKGILFSLILNLFYFLLGLHSMDWLDLLAVQVTLKSLLQHHSSKASILRCSAFFIVQLSHPYLTRGKTIALTRWTFVGKVMSLFF